MRHPKLLIPISLVITTLVLAAQQPDFTTSNDRDFLPAGPFLFEPGAIHPTYMDAFDERPVVKSPDGKHGVTVTGPKKSYEAWITIFLSTLPDGPVQVWPIQASADVLWKPDSRAFALTDNRSSNRSYVLICGTEFRMGESDEGLGVQVTDLTPIVEKAFEEPARKYYGTDNYDIRLFYAKALRWTGNNDLLVGVSTMTSGPTTSPNRGLKEWNVAYVVEVPNRRVLRELDKEQLLSEYKIKTPD